MKKYKKKSYFFKIVREEDKIDINLLTKNCEENINFLNQQNFEGFIPHLLDGGITYP